MPERHFPEPWFVEELDACFVVKDLNGQALAYMYFEKESRHRHRPSELLTRDEARRIAAICPVAGVAGTLRRQPCQFSLRSLPERRGLIRRQCFQTATEARPCG